MSTDFSYGGKQNLASGPFKPSGKDMPLDARTRINTYSEKETIPNPFVGMIVTVLTDENNNNEMQDYKVKSLKANSAGIANMVIDEMIPYIDYLGVSAGGGSGEGLTSTQKQQLTTAYEHSQSKHVTSDDLNNIDAISLNGKKISGPMTKAEYDAITVKEVDTIYLVTDENSPIEGIPSYSSTDANKVLAVNSTGTALAWINAPSGSGTGLTNEQLNQLAMAYEHSQTEHFSPSTLDDYQLKTDNNLQTTAKTVSGSINELADRISNLSTGGVDGAKENRYDPTKIGYRLFSTDGTFSYKTNTSVSTHLIPITPGATIERSWSTTSLYALWDENKEVIVDLIITDGIASKTNFTLPDDSRIKYITLEVPYSIKDEESTTIYSSDWNTMINFKPDKLSLETIEINSSNLSYELELELFSEFTSELTQKDFVNEGYINKENKYVNDSTYKNTGLRKIPEGLTHLYLKLDVATNVYSIIFFKDSDLYNYTTTNKNLVYTSTSSLDTTLAIPEGSVYVYVQQETSKLTNDIIVCIPEVKFTNLYDDILVNEYEIKNGKVVSEFNDYAKKTTVRSSNFIACDGVSKIEIVSAMPSTRNILNFYSDNKYSAFISSVGGGASAISNQSFSVPSNAKYVVVQIDMEKAETNGVSTHIRFMNTKKRTSNPYIVEPIPELIYGFDNSILNNRHSISDNLSFTSSFMGEAELDSRGTGRIYVSTQGSRTKYGEVRDLIAFCETNVTNPSEIEHYIVAEHGVEIEGTKYYYVHDTVCIDLGTTVRVFFTHCDIANTSELSYLYRDFNKTTKTFGSVNTVMVTGGLEMNATTIRDHISNKGGTLNTTESTRICMVSKIVKHGDYYYTVVTGWKQSPVIIKSSDCATWDLLACPPIAIDYEAQVSFIGDNMYLFSRGITDNIWKSTDLGVSFTKCTETTDKYTQRCHAIEYKDGILLLHSNGDDYKFKEYTDIYNPGRHNAIFEYITENEDGSLNIERKLRLDSKYGIIYPVLINNKGDVYMIYSNSEMNKNKVGRDSNYLVKIGEFFGGTGFKYLP